MTSILVNRGLLTLAVAGLALSAPAEARSHQGHGHCLRFNKTTGAVAGAAGGAVLGKVIFGGPVATIGGAAAGAYAGHKLARNGRKRCR